MAWTELGEFNESIDGMIEEADLTTRQAKQLKLRIRQTVYDGDLRYLRTDEKEIVGIELDPDKMEIILSVVDLPA